MSGATRWRWIAGLVAGAACAQGTVDLTPDDASSDCGSCADAHADAGRHDATYDSGTQDANDAPSEAGDDASFDAGDDSTSDTGADSPPDSPADVFDAGGFDAAAVCSGLFDAGVYNRYGNLTPYASNSSHGPNYLLGSPLSIPQGGTLVGFGVYARKAGPQMQMALYTDSGGQPGTLVAQTTAVPMCVGTMEIPASSAVSINAGSYWIMGIYDLTASIGIDYSNASAKVDYVSLTFGSQLPATFPLPTTYSGQAFNYYAIVQ